MEGDWAGRGGLGFRSRRVLLFQMGDFGRKAAILRSLHFETREMGAQDWDS